MLGSTQPLAAEGAEAGQVDQAARSAAAAASHSAWGAAR